MKIPFNSPYIGKEEIDALARAIKSMDIGGNGPIGREIEKILSEIHDVKFSLLMTSCTHSLETALRVLDVSDGQEIICPSFSFPSAANAVLLGGGNIIFAEIDQHTLNIDPEDLEKHISPKTKGIIVIHYAGVSCEMDKILEIARMRKLFVVEDAAQGIMASYKGRSLASLGDIGCLSFHSTKNIVCGEGGAFLTNNKNYFMKAEIIREKGTNRSQFLTGKIDHYSWVDLGSSYVLSELHAAVLQSQLKKLKKITKERKRVYESYMNGLRDLEQKGKIRLPSVPDNCQPNYHIFYMILEQGDRKKFLNLLRESGIEATSHFSPLHLSPMGKRLGYKEGDFPITEKAAARLIRLPIYPDLNESQISYIIDKIHTLLR